MDWNQKICNFLILLIFLVEFSAQDRLQDNANEVEGNDGAKLKEDLLSAARRGDMSDLRRAIWKGALEEYGFRYKAGHNKLIGHINFKLGAIEALQEAKLVVVPSDEFLSTNGNDGRLFNATLIPGIDLVTPLLLNMAAVESWNETDLRGLKPLHAICYLPDVEPRIVKYILGSGVDINDRCNLFGNMTALDVATCNGNLPVVQLLVESGADINAFREVPVDPKYEGGYINFLQMFPPQEVFSSPRTMHHSPLVTAIEQQRMEVVDYLLSRRADDTVGGQSWAALFLPVIHGDAEVLESLLEYGSDVNSRNHFGSSALHLAADRGRLAMANILLKFGAAVSGPDDFGWTPLHVASFASRNAALVELLLNRDSTLVHATTDRGFTPLNLAAAGSDNWFLSCLATVIAQNFSTNLDHVCKRTPDYSTSEDQVEIIQLLLDRGADVDHQDDLLGWSTLHWAAAMGDLKVAKILLEKYEANVDAKSKIGMSPSQTAAYFGMKQLSQVLDTVLRYHIL